MMFFCRIFDNMTSNNKWLMQHNGRNHCHILFNTIILFMWARHNMFSSSYHYSYHISIKTLVYLLPYIHSHFIFTNFFVKLHYSLSIKHPYHANINLLSSDEKV